MKGMRLCLQLERGDFILKSDDGFTLVEVITAMMIMSVITFTIVPLLVQVYKERVSIQESQKATFILTDLVQQWLHENITPHDNVILQDYPTITVDSSWVETNQLKVCLHWTSKNERNYSRCKYGKKLE